MPKTSFFEIKRLHPFHTGVQCKYCKKTIKQAPVWRVEMGDEVSFSCMECNPTIGKLEKIVNGAKDQEGCVACGDYVPEGRMVCPLCEKDPSRAQRREGRFS